MSDYLEKFKKRHEGYFQRGRDIITSGDWHLKRIKNYSEKEESFKAENAAVHQMVKRLSAFIIGAEGDRHLPSTQRYIDNIVEIIDIHLLRIEKYYQNNVPTEVHKQKGKIQEEQEFQQFIFNGEIKIEEELDKLNIAGDMNNLKINFHSGKLATLPFKKPLEDFSLDIRDKIESLDIDWDLVIDHEFLISKDKEDIPDYNPRKHFWDQGKETLQFYVSEWNKIKYGFEVDGYKIHPWLYFHLNYFKTPIPQPDKSEPIMNPPLRRNEWYFCEIIKKAEELDKGAIFIFGTRRFGKSVMEASYLYWKSLISPNTQTSVTISNDEDRISITDKISTAMKNMHPAFKVPTNIENWEKMVELGLKTNLNEKIKLCDVRVTNLDSGSKGAAQKGAGGAPVAYIYDESGKSDFLAAYNAAKFSFKTIHGWKTIPIFTGTGSNTDITQDAEKVLSNPTLYDFLPMDWDLLEYRIPKEAITWERREFGFFVPGQMGYEDIFNPYIPIKFSDFLGVKSKELDKITFNETDWLHNSKALLDEQKRLKNLDRSEHQAFCVFVPTDPEHCLMSAKNNPFPAQVAKTHKEKLIAQGNSESGVAKPVELRRDDENPLKIIAEISDKQVASYPYTGGFIDAPVLLYEDIPEVTPPMYMYFAGLDDYKHEQSDGDSLGCITIYKRDLQLDEFCGTPVATLTTRPDPHGNFHKQIHMLLDAFNAICFPENEDMDIKKYFDKLGLSYKYLGTSFDVSQKLNFTNTGNRKYGWQPTKITTPFVINLVVDYCKREIEIKDNNGNVVGTKLGVELIKDIHLLEEIIKYKEDGNFDRIISFGSALFYDHYCNITYKFPRIIKQEVKDENDWWAKEKQAQKQKNKFFSKTRRSLL